MPEFLLGLGEATANAVMVSYGVGMVWTFLSWIRTIHETQARAKMAVDRRDKNLANALRQSARDTYAEGLWVIPAWPLVVLRNLKTVLEVRKSYRERKQAEKNRSR
jgi:hypothetical protein